MPAGSPSTAARAGNGLAGPRQDARADTPPDARPEARHDPRLAADLAAGLTALGLSLPADAQSRLLDYLALLSKWNRVYNLTAVREPAEMLTHHLLDSLAVVLPLVRQLGAPADRGAGDPGMKPGLRQADPVARMEPQAQSGATSGATSAPGAPAPLPEATSVQAAVDPALATGRLLDVGSGAGLPGVVVAIACPGVTVVCVDTVAKKAAFIQQVATGLRLPNLQARHARVEDLRDVAPFDVVTSRAFASLADFVRLTAFHVKQATGCWMALKGRRPDAEMAELAQILSAPKKDGEPKPIAHVTAIEALQVPGLNEARCLVWMRPAGD